MPEQWSKAMLAAVTADVKAAKLPSKNNGEYVTWPPVAKLMLLIGNVEAHPNTWRNRHGRIEADAAERMSEEYHRDGRYAEALSRAIEEYRGMAAAPVLVSGGATKLESVPNPFVRMCPDCQTKLQVPSDKLTTCQCGAYAVKGWRFFDVENPEREVDLTEAMTAYGSPVPVNVRGVEVKGELVFEDKRLQPTDADMQALLDAYLNVVEKAKPLSIRQREATVRFSSNLPVGLSFFGDSHIGGWGWAAMRQLEDLRIVSETDGLFPTFMGDEWDNFIFGFGKWASVMRPAHQRKLGHYMFKRIFPKTVAVIGGNHIDWTNKVADIDLNAELAEKSNAVFLGARGTLNVKVGSQQYGLFLLHRAKGASSVNKTNSARVTANDVGGADIIVEADRHDPWEQTVYHNRRRQIWLRTGTYKIDDTYPDEIGFEQGKWDMPLAILFPDTHRILPFLDFRDGLDTLEYVRGKYRNGRGALVNA